MEPIPKDRMVDSLTQPLRAARRMPTPATIAMSNNRATGPNRPSRRLFKNPIAATLPGRHYSGSPEPSGLNVEAGATTPQLSDHGAHTWPNRLSANRYWSSSLGVQR